MTIPIIKARDIIKLSLDQVWGLDSDIEKGKIIIEDDFGERMKYHNRYLQLSWCIMHFHRMDRRIPFKLTHLIAFKQLEKGTTVRTTRNAMYDASDYFKSKGIKMDREVLWKQAYETVNLMYNTIITRLGAYVTSFNVTDFLDIVDHSEIKKLINELSSTPPSSASIDRITLEVNKIINTCPSLRTNPVANAIRSSFVDKRQADQVLLARGFVTDLDDSVFPSPITRGFFSGYDKLHDSFIESRTATRSTDATGAKLSDAQYFNRKMQLSVPVVTRLVPGDCGSQQYFRFKIYTASDLKAVNGLFRKTEAGIVPIREGDKSLIGTTVYLRTSLRCLIPDRDAICETCFGELSDSIPHNTNIGYVSATETCKNNAQNQMSFKHLTMSATIGDIVLSDYVQKFIQTKTGTNWIYVSSKLNTKELNLILQAKEATGLIDVNSVDSVYSLPIHNITSLTQVGFERGWSMGKPGSIDTLSVELGGRRASLSHDMLYYIKKMGWNLEPDGNYSIDMSKWNSKLPIFEMPMNVASSDSLLKAVERKIIGQKDKVRHGKGDNVSTPICNYDTPEEALMSLYELCGALGTNLTHLACIVYSFAIVDEANFDHNLPTGGADYQLGSFNYNLKMRSMTGVLSYQYQRSSIFSPGPFVIKDRAPHYLDPMFR